MRVSVSADELTGVAGGLLVAARASRARDAAPRGASRGRAPRLGVGVRSGRTRCRRRSRPAGDRVLLDRHRSIDRRKQGRRRARGAVPGRSDCCGGARWNDANVLALSLRATSEAELGEILRRWFAGEASTTSRRSRERRAPGCDRGGDVAGRAGPAVGKARSLGGGVLQRRLRRERGLSRRRYR